MTSTPTRTILVVDDEPSSVDMLGFLLEEHGYRVMTAQDGRDALELTAREPVDLILSDVMMPVMNGVDLCAELQRRDGRAAVPLILVSAAVEWIQLNGCEPAAVMPKPVDVDELMRRIRRTLPMSGASRTNVT
jgi:DNA-binding response OmpR family regulator